MKKAVMMFVLLAVVAAMAQKPKESVAVYMAGTEPVAVKGAYKVLGAELAKSLAKSGNYTAVDRTDEVIKVLSAADIFKQDGAIDADKAKRAGTLLGAQVMCVAEITEVMKSYFLEARLVNVETAEVSKVATAYGGMSGAEEVARSAQEVALELIPAGTSMEQAFDKAKFAGYTFREIAANPDKAMRDYTKAIRAEPLAEYYYKRAQAYALLGEADIAVADLADAIRLAPNEAEYYAVRGDIYVYMVESHNDAGAIDKGIADYTQAIRLNPNATAYYNRGLMYSHKGDHDRAIADYNEAIRLNPRLARAYNNRGLAYGNKGDNDKALSDYNQAIRLDPNNVEAYTNRGGMYDDKGDHDRAIADYNQAIRLDPNNLEAYNNRGNAYLNKGDNDRAISDYTQAIKLNPNVAQPYSGRGLAYANKEDYANAISDWETSLRINSNNPEVRRNLEKIKRLSGQPPNPAASGSNIDRVRGMAQPQGGQQVQPSSPAQQATKPSAPPPLPVNPPNPELDGLIARYEKLLEPCATTGKSDRCADVMCTLVALYYDKAKESPTRAGYRKSTDIFWRLVREYQVFKRLPDAYYLMGALYLEVGHADTANIIFTQLLNRYPKSPRVSSATAGLGDIAFAAGDFRKAYEHYSKVKPKDVDIALWETVNYRMGVSAYNNGDYRTALSQLRVYVSGCDTGTYKSKAFRDKAIEYILLAEQRK
jgi:tetratricopeptide (TPR) repeat protein